VNGMKIFFKKNESSRRAADYIKNKKKLRLRDTTYQQEWNEELENTTDVIYRTNGNAIEE